jgi:hypothetical protein
MNYLQLHDGPGSFPPYNGKLQPLKNALDPYAPGAPVMMAGACAAVLPGALQKGSAQAWNDSIKKALDLYNTISKKQGMSASFVPGSLAVIKKAIQYLPQIIALGFTALQGFTKNQINSLAQQYYDQNRYNMQNLCTMSALELESQMLTLDKDIALAGQNADLSPWLQKGQYKRQLAVLSELRVIYENQLAMVGGSPVAKKGLLNLGLIAAALSLFR